MASDSLLTVIDQSHNIDHVEWGKSKIIPVPKLKACISYWGFAGEYYYTKPSNKWGWQTYEWLKKKALNPDFNTLEEFCIDLQNGLRYELDKIKIDPIFKGIGLHIGGIERINDYLIPELFLLSNYTDPSYTQVGDLRLSRESYHTIYRHDPSPEHRNIDFRLKVSEFFRQNRLLIYNNGDPVSFGPISSSIREVLYQNELYLKPFDQLRDLVSFAMRPIEVVSRLQGDFYKEEHRKVGGRAHV